MISSFTFRVCKYIRSQISEHVVILEDTSLNACVLGIPPLSQDYNLWWFRCPILTKSWADDLEDIDQDQKLLYIKTPYLCGEYLYQVCEWYLQWKDSYGADTILSTGGWTNGREIETSIPDLNFVVGGIRTPFSYTGIVYLHMSILIRIIQLIPCNPYVWVLTITSIILEETFLLMSNIILMISSIWWDAVQCIKNVMWSLIE